MFGLRLCLCLKSKMHSISDKRGTGVSKRLFKSASMKKLRWDGKERLWFVIYTFKINKFCLFFIQKKQNKKKEN